MKNALHYSFEKNVLGPPAERTAAEGGVNRPHEFEEFEEFLTDDEFLPFWDGILCSADELLGFDE